MQDGKARSTHAESDEQRLFFALTEQMKLPFLQIARASELVSITGDITRLSMIEKVADNALQLLDSYLLSTRLSAAGDALVLEPVSLSATLDDIAHKMEKIAHDNRCDLELHIAGRYGPIMAHPAGLQAALLNLGKVFIDVQNERTHTKRPVITLAAHRTSKGIVAGMFSDVEGLNIDMFKRAHKMYGSARQPLAQLTAQNGAGVFVADSLLVSMSSGLRVARHNKLTGLAATFAPSQQLALV